MAVDKRLIKLAIRQLLDNALKYTSSETVVEMGAQVKDGLLSVEVTDYGQGIPDEEQIRIFDISNRPALETLCKPGRSASSGPIARTIGQ